ncbi:uncharacterized protein LOC8265165 [Ricinus communis]|uniref:Uncharacterized protein n=1 Tax=Ricinus communis TaxID=3988 RepID=B9RNI8_RICCO|nr:uncharacterized protein LOC8265165 [Ricinus communis]EEF47311.1 conserved hypothetical protein [Ricinus communis]|eukprot:XP_002515327.1 uncharacterized protein LOC8265165 [Ricinus communis]
MEQSRLAAAATRFYRLLYLARHNQAAQRRFAAVATGRTGDPAVYSEERNRELKPAVYSGDPEETENKYEPESAKRDVESEAETEYRTTSSKGTEALTPPRPPHASSPRLVSIGVNNPVEPHIQQKRENSTLEETSCAGLDGTPWPKQKEKGEEEDEDENEYYRHHKASPLSEIEIADTRKPITRATDGSADAGKGRDVIGWLPEQLETAEETMERARRIWTENATRGDPDSPQGRVLRVLRGEWF